MNNDGIYKSFSHIPVRLQSGEVFTLSLEDIIDIEFFDATAKFHFAFKSVPMQTSVSQSMARVIDYLEIAFPPALSILLGFGEGVHRLRLMRNVSTSKGLFSNLVFKDTSLRLPINKFADTGHTDRSNYFPDLQRGVRNLYIYTNIVENTFLGNQLLSFISVIPITGKVGEYKYHPVFIPVHKACNTHTLEEVTIKILDYKGEKIRFRHGSGSVHLLLHFKRLS